MVSSAMRLTDWLIDWLTDWSINQKTELRKHGRSNWHKDFPDTATEYAYWSMRPLKKEEILTSSGTVRITGSTGIQQITLFFFHKVSSWTESKRSEVSIDLLPCQYRLWGLAAREQFPSRSLDLLFTITSRTALGHTRPSVQRLPSALYRSMKTIKHTTQCNTCASEYPRHLHGMMLNHPKLDHQLSRHSDWLRAGRPEKAGVRVPVG
jgi:hypothetical protein